MFNYLHSIRWEHALDVEPQQVVLILRKVLSVKLIAVFVGVVGLGILGVGFLFNLIFA